jgi:hypothetical protein
MSIYPSVFSILIFFLSITLLLLVKRSYTNRAVSSNQSLLTDSGQIISFIVCSQIASLFYEVSIGIWAVNLTIGCFIGYYFMFIYNLEVKSSGFFLGGLAAVMGTMIGFASNDPTICGLPPSTLSFRNMGVALEFISALSLFLLNLFLVGTLCKSRYKK